MEALYIAAVFGFIILAWIKLEEFGVIGGKVKLA